MLNPTEVVQVQSYKIPVDQSVPHTDWIICLDIESILPTDKELLQMRSLVEYTASKIYNPTFLAKLLAMPLAKCAGHNTHIFRKVANVTSGKDGWFYRRSSWTEGPMWIPSPMEKDFHPYTLIEAMDRDESILTEQWAAWKKSHPDIFKTI